MGPCVRAGWWLLLLLLLWALSWVVGVMGTALNPHTTTTTTTRIVPHPPTHTHPSPDLPH